MPDTIKYLDHGNRKFSETASPNDYVSLIRPLQEISKALFELVERAPKVSFPEIHNEITVPPARVDVHVPPIDNRITVNPTPIDVHVAPPTVENHVRCEPVVTFDVAQVVRGIYILSGAILVSSVGIIAAMIFH